MSRYFCLVGMLVPPFFPLFFDLGLFGFCHN